MNFLNSPPKIDKLTQKELNSFNQATHCYICNEEFTKDNFKVKDHCHFTGKYYRCSAHTKCNLLVRIQS